MLILVSPSSHYVNFLFSVNFWIGSLEPSIILCLSKTVSENYSYIYLPFNSRPAMTFFIIEPFWFNVPLTLQTLILIGSGSACIFSFFMNSPSINTPAAPESTRAGT